LYGAATCRYAEREALRAVRIGNNDLLRNLVIGPSEALLPQVHSARSEADKTTPLLLALKLNNLGAVKLLVEDLKAPVPRHPGRKPTLQRQGTGTMSVKTLGYATGKIGAARGGKEMNNALVDSPERYDNLASLDVEQIFRIEGPTEETLELLFTLTGRSVFDDNSLAKGINSAAAVGNIVGARFALARVSFGFSAAHEAALFSDDAQAVRVWKDVQGGRGGRGGKAKSRAGGSLSPVHLGKQILHCSYLGKHLEVT